MGRRSAHPCLPCRPPFGDLSLSVPPPPPSSPHLIPLLGYHLSLCLPPFLPFDSFCFLCALLFPFLPVRPPVLELSCFATPALLSGLPFRSLPLPIPLLVCPSLFDTSSASQVIHLPHLWCFFLAPVFIFRSFFHYFVCLPLLYLRPTCSLSPVFHRGLIQS